MREFQDSLFPLFAYYMAMQFWLKAYPLQLVELVVSI